jgi:hypothetical protein
MPISSFASEGGVPHTALAENSVQLDPLAESFASRLFEKSLAQPLERTCALRQRDRLRGGVCLVPPSHCLPWKPPKLVRLPRLPAAPGRNVSIGSARTQPSDPLPAVCGGCQHGIGTSQTLETTAPSWRKQLFSTDYQPSTATAQVHFCTDSELSLFCGVSYNCSFEGSLSSWRRSSARSPDRIEHPGPSWTSTRPAASLAVRALNEANSAGRISRTARWRRSASGLALRARRRARRVQGSFRHLGPPSRLRGISS